MTTQESEIQKGLEHQSVASALANAKGHELAFALDDPCDPYNWSASRKAMTAILYSASQLVTTMSASMIAPALPDILDELHMDASAGQIAFSVFFLGLGLAPFIVAPLAEMYGRRPIWLAGNAFYVFWNAMCPVGRSPALLILGRVFSAAGASVGVTLTSPAVADMYHADKRGRSIAVASILPYIGPALGPIVGGIASQRVRWPWLFWILSIFDVAVIVLGFLFIRESYARVLLQRRVATPSRISFVHRVHQAARAFGLRLGPAARRPIRLLVKRPIIQLTALGMAVAFGIYTLVLGTFAALWQTKYHQSSTTASLHYIAIALGAFICAQAGGPLMDLIWRRTKAAHPDSPPVPEYRLPYMVISLVPGLLGLFWYAWAAEKHAHWVAVDFGVGVFTCGSFMFTQALLAYILDEFPSTHTASANAAARLGTYLLGFVFPIFAPELYAALGYGWGTSLLGILFVVLGGSTVAALWLFGERLRVMGRTVEETGKIE